MNDTIPTVEEFGKTLGKYHGRINKRMNRLGGLFLALVGVIILIVVFSIIFNKGLLALVLIPVCMAGIAIIGLYIVITYSKWHKANGVFCDACGKNLIVLLEEYEYYPDEGETPPIELHCPKCKKLIAKTLNHSDSPNGVSP